jgi:hypothetical protein
MSGGGAPAAAYQNVMRGKLQLKGKALTVEKTYAPPLPRVLT